MKWIDLQFFKDGADMEVCKKIVEDVENNKSVLPDVSNIMRALDITPFNNVKVVILGQDPYPTKGHANGLAFSVNNNVTPLPRSLQNIYKELYEDVGVTRSNGDLSDWAEQGVLLLNATLTVVEGSPGSHADIGWHKLTREVIESLSDNKENLVFILWGKKAQTKRRYIDEDKHLVITSVHPSPLSARKGFFGSKPFSQTNEYLKRNNIKEIDW